MRWDERSFVGMVALAVGGCAAPLPSVEKVTVPVDSKVEEDTSRLWHELAKAPLEGLALVWSDEVLFPSAEAARAAKPKRRHRGESPRAVQILSDEGDVVKVRTWLSPRVRPGFSALTAFDLTLYATRDQLVPVLRSVVEEEFGDGTGYVLYEGLALSIEEKARPLIEALEPLDVAIEPKHVGLAFPLFSEDPSMDDDAVGEEVACTFEARENAWSAPVERRRVSITSLATHKENEAKKSPRGGPSSEDRPSWAYALGRRDYQTCSLVGEYDEDVDAPVKVDGKALMQAKKVGGDRCFHGTRAFRGPSQGAYLVYVPLERAVVRVAVPEVALRPKLGCGGGAMGVGLRGTGAGIGLPPTKRVPVVRGKVKVYFADGRHAGYQMSGERWLEGEPSIGGRPCVEHPNVSARICYDPADVVEVEVAR